MFEWLIKNRKNNNNNDEFVDEKKTVEYTSTDDSYLLISTWMKKNNITDLTFEEILYQLGLVYDKELSLNKAQISISNSLWNNPDFLGAIIFAKWCTKSNANNNEIGNKFSKYLKEITSSDNIFHYILFYNNSINVRIDYKYYDENIGNIRASITKEYIVRKNKDGKTLLEENKEVYTNNTDYCSLRNPSMDTTGYDRIITNDEINIMVYQRIRGDIKDKISIKITTYDNNFIILDEKNLIEGLWKTNLENNIFNTLKKIISKISDNDSFKSINITYVKDNKEIQNLSYNLDELTYDYRISVKTEKYNRMCNIENYLENGYYYRKITIYYERGITKVLKVKSTSEIDIYNELETISYLLSSNWLFADNDMFKRISELSFFYPSNNLVSVELCMYKKGELLSKNEWKRNYQINEINSNNLKTTGPVLRRRK